MTTEVMQGEIITLTSQWYEYAGGPATDVTSLTITITLSGAGSPVVGPTSTGIVHAATGVYTYAWTVPVDATVGDATIVWEGVDGDLDDVNATEIITVLASTDVVHGYCTLAQLRAHLGDGSSNLSEALLTRAINATSRSIDKWCGRRFWQDSTVVVRTYRPDDPYIAWVNDISTTTGLVIKTDTTGDGTFATTWATTDYQLEPLDADDADAAYAWWRIVAIDRYTFPTPVRRPTLQVTAKFGWAITPDEVEEACLLRAAAVFKRSEAVFGVAGFGEFGVVRIGRQDPDVVELLSPFRRFDAVGI